MICYIAGNFEAGNSLNLAVTAAVSEQWTVTLWRPRFCDDAHSEILGGNSFIVRGHLTSKYWPMRARAAGKSFQLYNQTCVLYVINVLLYRYWWNTRIFPFTKKIISSLRAVKILFYLSRVRILVLPWLLTYAFAVIGFFLFFIRILTFSNRKYKYYCLYFSFITLYPSFISFLWHAFCDRWPF